MAGQEPFYVPEEVKAYGWYDRQRKRPKKSGTAYGKHIQRNIPSWLKNGIVAQRRLPKEKLDAQDFWSFEGDMATRSASGKL